MALVLGKFGVLAISGYPKQVSVYPWNRKFCLYYHSVCALGFPLTNGLYK
jgi:hypothetical protein